MFASFNNLQWKRRGMAKNTGDLILRDRMQFDFDSNGDRTTLYGRIDTSGYVDPVSRQGLAVKEIYFQLRQSPSSKYANTGIFETVAEEGGADVSSAFANAGLKLYATSRAYENASEVGIASPDVLCVKTYTSHTALNADQSGTNQYTYQWEWYGPRDLHPEVYTLESDLLIGVAADDWSTLAGGTLEIDILMIAEPIKVTTERMNEILSQAQDL